MTAKTKPTLFESQREVAALRKQLAEKTAECERLAMAIRAHRAQKADDRCIEDDDRLYEALGDGVKCDRRVGDKAAMLANCARFIDRRCEAGGWSTYAALEKALASAQAENAKLHEDALAVAQERHAECLRRQADKDGQQPLWEARAAEALTIEHQLAVLALKADRSALVAACERVARAIRERAAEYIESVQLLPASADAPKSMADSLRQPVLGDKAIAAEVALVLGGSAK